MTLAPLNTLSSRDDYTPTPVCAGDAPLVRSGRESMSVNLLVPFRMVTAELVVVLNWTDPCLVDQRSDEDGNNNINNDTDGVEAVARDNER